MSAVDAALAEFWRNADDAHPERLRAQLEALLVGHPDGAVQAFERASLQDFLGEEAAAIPLYRAALSAGLAGNRRTQAVIQLGSSLRNVGDASGAIAVLKQVAEDDPLASAAQAFLSLSLHDDDKPTEAVRLALRVVAPHLPAYSRAVGAYAAELPARDRVRAIAVGLLVHDGFVLAEEYRPNGKHQGFLRAPGGGIDFGETAATAVRREFAEELGVTLDDAQLLTVAENIFDAHGKRGHEIAFVFAVRSAVLEALPRGERLPVADSDTTVGWYDLELIRDKQVSLYPHGILDLLS
jgi:8-oxo-dGTP pyrophosphatase MutT (NUDIX family)